MSEEVELRLAAHPRDLKRLSRRAHLNGFSLAPARTHKLHSVYYDTRGLDLAKAGLALRVRRTQDGFVQTVKNAGNGALANARTEIECAVNSQQPDVAAIPDDGMRAAVQTLAGTETLEPLVETDIVRTTRLLKTGAGDEVELAFDEGEIRPNGNGSVVPVSELELELKQGSPLALYEAARDLSRRAPLAVEIESKAERGLRALQGRGIDTPKAGRISLSPDCTAEEAFRTTLQHCLTHISRNVLAVGEARDPEGVHQIRVGLRRLRAALSGYGDCFRVRALEDLRSRAKTLADIFGATRELDVFANELLKPVEDASKREGLPQLRLALEELHREAWNRSAKLVHSDDFTGFLIDLAAAIEGRIWREHPSPEQIREFERPARELACGVLDRLLKKACKHAKHLSRLGVEQRHRLRISLKKLRYGAEFFAPIFAQKPVGDFLQRLSKLQDLFGALNDAATAESILRRLVEHAGEQGSPALHEAAAFVDGWHQSRIEPTWKQAKKRWKRFSKTEPFWRT